MRLALGLALVFVEPLPVAAAAEEFVAIRASKNSLRPLTVVTAYSFSLP